MSRRSPTQARKQTARTPGCTLFGPGKFFINTLSFDFPLFMVQGVFWIWHDCCRRLVCLIAAGNRCGKDDYVSRNLVSDSGRTRSGFFAVGSVERNARTVEPPGFDRKTADDLDTDPRPVFDARLADTASEKSRYRNELRFELCQGIRARVHCTEARNEIRVPSLRFFANYAVILSELD
jgi:hypothetical protein